MSEKLTVVDGKGLDYEGLFEAKELYKVIEEYAEENKFDRNEFMNAEHIYEDSKQLDIDVRPYKKISDYVKLEIKIKIKATNLKYKEVEVNGIKRKYYHGHVNVKFFSYLITDYENTWEMRPLYYLLRTLVDKLIYKGYMDSAKKELIMHTNGFYEEIRSYLNMHRFKA